MIGLVALLVPLFMAGLLGLSLPRLFRIESETGEKGFWFRFYLTCPGHLWSLLFCLDSGATDIQVKVLGYLLNFKERGSEPTVSKKKKKPKSKKQKRVRWKMLCVLKRFHYFLPDVFRWISIHQGEGTLRFGTGDPAQTGIVWAWVQAVLTGASLNRSLSVTPDFVNQTFEGQCAIQGRFHAFRMAAHFIKAAYHALRCIRWQKQNIATATAA